MVIEKFKKVQIYDIPVILNLNENAQQDVVEYHSNS